MKASSPRPNLARPLIKALAALAALALVATASAMGQISELHHRIAPAPHPVNDGRIALTLDACGGGFDAELIQFLIQQRIPATLFVTKKWFDKNPLGTAMLTAHLDLFDIEDHGENHILAVIGAGRKVYGISGVASVPQLRQEVRVGASAIERATGVPARWYRGATAEYDVEAADEIRHMGFRIAGFSVNADAGATLKKRQIIERLRHVRDGDVIIAHMNKPASESAEGLMVGLAELQQRGLVFTRLDQVNLVVVK